MTPDFLNSMLTPEAAAEWLQISPVELSIKSSGPDATVPAFRFGKRSVRYNPRTIIAVCAARARVPDRIIAASFGEREKEEAA